MMLPVDLQVLRCQLLLFYKALHSNRNVLKVCAGLFCSIPDVVVECADINICFMYCSTNDIIKCRIWDKFVKLVGR